MRKKLLFIISGLVVLAMLVTACGRATPEPTAVPVAPTAVPPTAVPPTPVPPAPEPEAKLKVGQVTDMGGIDDKSFNATAWKGVQDAMDQLGVEGNYIESQQQADYAKNIQEFLSQDYDLIVTVGFLLGVDTAKAAVDNPDRNFAIVDYAYPDCWPGAEPGKDCGSDVPLDNVLGLTFATDEAAFLAGYLAAGMSETGIVGTFGGIKIPTVTIFMRGLEAGIKYYNQQHGTAVELLGWETAADEGLFTGNFESTDDGRRFAESLMDEGADIIMPVAGPVGLGSAAACKERGTMLIGVDSDWYFSAPEFSETYLTSVLKNMDVAVFNASQAVVDGTFAGGIYVGTLANSGVEIADYHDYADQVSADLTAEIESAKAALISGALSVDAVLAAPPPPAAGELGSAEKPIQVLFVPSVDAGVIVSGGELMAGALEAATNLKFEVSVPTSYAATIESMCASPGDTIGFIPALGYVLANQKCGVEVGAAAVRYGWSVYWAQYLVARDSDYESLEDLAGAKWAVPDLGSTSGYLFPLVELSDLGVEPGEIVEAGGHPQAALALFNGEVDFATTYFSPPLTDPRWAVGDDPEPFDPMAVALNESGRAFSGDIRVLDARASTLETAPDMYKETRVLALSGAIPNDTMSFGPEFPEALRAQIIDALAKFMTTEACQESICSSDFYNWTGVDPIGDADYDIIRKLIALMGYTEEDIFSG